MKKKTEIVQSYNGKNPVIAGYEHVDSTVIDFNEDASVKVVNHIFMKNENYYETNVTENKNGFTPDVNKKIILTKIYFNE